MEETLSGSPAPDNPPDLTEGPALAIRTGPNILAEARTQNRKAAGCDNIPQKPRSHSYLEQD